MCSSDLIGALIGGLAGGLAGCQIDGRSDSFRCALPADCTGGRVCVDGWCVVGDGGVAIDADLFWHHYARDAFGGVIMSVVASQIVGSSERSEAMFAAMAVRHTRHALDLGAESLV